MRQGSCQIRNIPSGSKTGAGKSFKRVCDDAKKAYQSACTGLDSSSKSKDAPTSIEAVRKRRDYVLSSCKNSKPIIGPVSSPTS